MTSKENVYSLAEYAKKFVKEYKNPKIEPKVVEAIIVDFINFFALRHYGIKLSLNTKDLRDETKIFDAWYKLEKETIFQALNFQKSYYNREGIINNINKNKHLNECEGLAIAENQDALEVLNEFLKGYKTFK